MSCDHRPGCRCAELDRHPPAAGPARPELPPGTLPGRYTVTMLCEFGCGPTIHEADGTTNGRMAQVIARCPVCSARYLIRATVECLNPNQRITPAKAAGGRWAPKTMRDPAEVLAAVAGSSSAGEVGARLGVSRDVAARLMAEAGAPSYPKGGRRPAPAALLEVAL